MESPEPQCRQSHAAVNKYAALGDRRLNVGALDAMAAAYEARPSKARIGSRR
jgi:hypothetical protein